MSNKRLFQVLDEMNVNDDVNKTATVGCCFDMVAADTVKAGGIVKMGVPAEAITRIFLGECQPFLILLDKKEYHRLKDLPVEDKLKQAEQEIKQLTQWKKEATLLLDPLLEWGQSQKDIPLGRSITHEVLRRAKLYTEAEQRADRYEKALKEIRDMDHTNPDAYAMKLKAYWALTPKPSTDDTTNG